MNEWYRSSNWSAEEERDFFSRLNRARPGNRAQYLRLKGIALCDSLDEQVQASGVDLLMRVVSDFPDESHQVAGAHSRLARFFEQTGEEITAFRHYERAIAVTENDAFRSKLRLAELIVRNELVDEYGYAARLLNELESDELITNDIAVRLCISRARLAQATGNQDLACKNARLALELLADNESSFPRHPVVGQALVDDQTFTELSNLAEG